MRKVLLSGIAALALASPVKAKADELPSKYLGGWCIAKYAIQEGKTRVYEEGTRDECNDGHIKIMRDSYTGWEHGCRFTSVRKTSKVFPANTKPLKSDWIPEVIIESRCSGEGTIWKEKSKLTYGKGGMLMIEDLSPKNTRVCVIADPEDGWLNVRSKPRGQILAKLENGDSVFSLREYANDDRGYPWVKVETLEGWQGWVYEPYLRCRDE